MIPYTRDTHQVIPVSSVKIIGLGGAGTNMLERIALDGVEGAGLIALNTDIRTLGSCLAGEKIQLGTNLTKGLGTGGDPELGHQAVLEAEEPIREAIKGSRIVFLCVGLGGGTGSGAAPIVTRIAREEGAFVVVFATMPFAFEGKRRRDQAEAALNELAVLSNALVTFDNNRMGELVLAKQGIHDAFAAADHMICESIKAVLRLVIRPGLINVGLDDLMSALRTTRSRCLFGSGMAEGRDRTAKALRGALASPLLDQGTLLKDAQTVLVHLCGGEDLTLFEIELMMQSLGKFVPEKAHVLFGAAIDPAMNHKLSLTLISALPEDSLAMAPRESLTRGDDVDNPLLDPGQGFTKTTAQPAAKPVLPLARKLSEPRPAPAAVTPALFADEQPFAEPALPAAARPEPGAPMFEEPTEPITPEKASEEKPAAVMVAEFIAVPADDDEDLEQYLEAKPVVSEEAWIDEEEPAPPADVEETEGSGLPNLEAAGFSALPPKRPEGAKPWTTSLGPKETEPLFKPEPEPPKLKLGIKTVGAQSELSLDTTPRGRFEGENPNVVDGEDLDLPPFLRKKK